jgi:3-hydroxybutyryl-CoA dehydrogenase
VVALDTLLGLERGVRRVIMATPATRPDKLSQAKVLFGRDGTAVSVIRDSGGFVSQRIVASIVNTACEIAQQRIASPEHIDAAVRLGLSYPCGPLILGERIGPQRIIAVLNGMMAVYGDPRYRPGVWLSRRASLNLPLQHSD